MMTLNVAWRKSFCSILSSRRSQSTMYLQGQLNGLEAIYRPSGSSYSDCIKTIKSINKRLRNDGVLAPGSKATENVLALYESFDKPLRDIPVVHVGGTNGKGSVCFKISRALTANTLRAGLFVSPHISCFRERMQIDNQLISEESFVHYFNQVIRKCIELRIPATEFEVLFLMSTLYFRDENCSAVVLEVGVGGRYDATNVVNATLSVICSVSFDHMRFLGNTLDEICRNKAGIFKNQVPALIGPDVSQQVTKEVADEINAVLFTYEEACKLFSKESNGPNFSQTWTTTDKLNSNISFLSLCLLKRYCPRIFHSVDLQGEHTTNALLSSAPCRWEKHVYKAPGTNASIDVILDVGHNPAAIQAMGERLSREYPNYIVRCIYAMSRDKDISSCLRNLSEFVTHENLFFVQSKYFRAVPIGELKRIFYEESGFDLAESNLQLDIKQTIKETLDRACREFETSNRPTVVLICGTGYIMADAHEILGDPRPNDEDI